jgi:hypothetical protein
MGRPTNWNDADIAALRAGAAAGLSMGDVGKQIGRPRSAVSGKANRLGVRFHGDMSERYRERMAAHGRATAAMRAARAADPNALPNDGAGNGFADHFKRTA